VFVRLISTPGLQSNSINNHPTRRKATYSLSIMFALVVPLFVETRVARRTVLQQKYYPSCFNLCTYVFQTPQHRIYEGWNFNSGNYLFTTDTK